MQQVPTLLLGLGGIGSQVVDRVYNMVPEDRRDRIAAHAFDTNINDIASLKHLQEEHVTQTSTDDRVRDYLDKTDRSVRDWFPEDLPSGKTNHILLNKTLTDGAGQVRPVSRLAYRAVLENDQGLKKLQTQIDDIFRVDGGGYVATPRVMIVCSLAGGTGAGIFLQTALLLHQRLLEGGSKKVLIRGAFMLADILAKRTAIGEKPLQKENIRANTYACLRELDALTTQTTDTNIELEYSPNQADAEGRANLVVTPDREPYKFSFLYDFENTQGQNLAHFEHYMRQITRTVHLQLFSPISDEGFSEEDNEIIGTVESGGAGRYCGAGVSSLEYPYDDIVEYCALRWSSDSLSERWLRLDNDYGRELEAYERARDRGENPQRPRLSERYVRLLDTYATADNPDPFFKRIYRSVRQKDEHGRPTGTKAKAFVEAIEEEVKRDASNVPIVDQLVQQSKIQEGRLTDRDRAHSQVLRVEEDLTRLKEAVKKSIGNNKTAFAGKVLLRDCHDLGAPGGQAYRLNTWTLLGEEAPLHPVAVRYMLYQVLHRLDDRLQELRSENDGRWNTIKRYEKTYNDPETEDVVEEPEDRLREALDQGLVGRVFDSDFEAFVEEYRSKATSQRRSLEQYHRDKLLERVFSDVRDNIHTMLDNWERFFRNLDSVRTRIEADVEQRAREHDSLDDPMHEYVLASAEGKEALWDEIGRQLTGGALPDDISREIYLGQYKRLCKHMNDQTVREEEKETTESRFRENVVAWCRRELYKEGRLDKNIVRALYEEAEQAGQYKDEEKDDYIQDKLRALSGKAQPFVPDAPGSKSEKWGAHPDAVQDPDPTSDDRRGELSRGKVNVLINHDASDLVRDEAFSRHELLCYRSCYGLKVGDFPKFSAGSDVAPDGTYYKAYRKRIRKLTGQNEDTESVTPHLDKRWHIPVYLPDTINPQQFQRNKHRGDSAFVRGLALGFFEQITADGRHVWQFSGKRNPQLVRRQGEPVPSELHHLHEALYYNPYIVDEVMDKADNLRKKDKRDHPIKEGGAITQHRFHQGCHNVKGVQKDRNLLDAMMSYPLAARGTPGLLDKGYDILDHALGEIVAYYEFVFGPARTNTAQEKAADLIEKLRKKSPTYESADSDGQIRAQWDSRIGSVLDELRS